ncbi:MAG: sigma-70 family RNA polymerase sigma factor [Actinomycetota bacterium]|nr:sigma-70 family RNA polymerase sigma factor [Actinomycetota bacterium]
MNRPRDIQDLLREAAPQVLAAVVRRFGDFADAEDATQEAMLAATQQWPRQRTPDNPVGWLIQVASRRMVDQARSESARRDREALVAAREPRDPQPPADNDDTLTLMFMSCHPELTPASAIALTLRAVGGLTTTEIANAFLVPEATMAQRISRAKQTIRASAVPFQMPRSDEWAERLRSVLHVLYLIFNEGYLTSGGSELARGDLSSEAIRLTRIVRRALPDDPEVAGLLALMLLTEARRRARADLSGELIPLAEQDRSHWDRDLIAEGLELVAGAWSNGSVGEYLVQAQIAALHDQASGVEDTHWREIAGLYGFLERLTGNPMVSLNRAIAIAMVDGPSAGLSLLEPLSEPLAGHHRLHAVRAHLLEMAGEVDAALAEYETAASRTTSVPENHYLTMRAARLNERRRTRGG